MLLGAAIASEGDEGHGRDVWLSCAPADEHADHLTAGLVGALGIAVGSDVDAILEHVWSQAPTEVCLVFDDVHEIPAKSTGAAVLERLVVDLPGNGHTLMASAMRCRCRRRGLPRAANSCASRRTT